MKPGDLRRFRDSLTALGLRADHFEGGTFVVLEVSGRVGAEPTRVDILIGGRCETDLGYHWVRDNSEVLNAAG